MSACILDDEEGRIRALERLDVLDTGEEKPFETLIGLVEQTLEVPMCAISLVHRTRQWFKARRGVDAPETSREVSFCTHTIQRNEPLIVPNATQDPLFATNPLVVGAPFIASYIGAPIRVSSGYNVGSICAIDIKPRNFPHSAATLLKHFAKIAADELELRRIASTDELTGVLSRRAWMEAAGVEMAHACRYGQPLAVAMIDIDHFKRVNDTFGHPVGDEVIKAVAKVCAGSIRDNELFGRLGGEEFALLLPGMSAGQAAKLGERLREAVEASSLDLGPQLRVTVSIGIAELTGSDADLMSLIRSADEALYRAKKAGRNQVCLA